MIRLPKFIFPVILTAIFLNPVKAEPVFKEVRTASNEILVLFFTSDTFDINEINIEDRGAWTINGQAPVGIYKHATQADACDHHIYLKTSLLVLIVHLKTLLVF